MISTNDTLRVSVGEMQEILDTVARHAYTLGHTEGKAGVPAKPEKFTMTLANIVSLNNALARKRATVRTRG